MIILEQPKAPAPVEIVDFEKEVSEYSDLIVQERVRDSGLPRYYAHFNHSEIKEGPMLLGCSGNGNSIDEALQDYCREISGRVLVFHSRTSRRREILVPDLVHTKLLGR